MPKISEKYNKNMTKWQNLPSNQVTITLGTMFVENRGNEHY